MRLITSAPHGPLRRREDGLEVIRLPRPPGERTLRRRGYLPYANHGALSRLALSLLGADLAHAVYPVDAVAAARWGGPSVFSFMGVPDLVGLRHQRRMLEFTLRACERCDRTVALSDYAAAAFRDWLGLEVPVIHPGVDLSVFTPAGERADPPVIVCPADAREPRKEIGLLIAAFAGVRRELPTARLLLSRPRAPELPAAPGVEWVDLDDRARLAAVYATASVAVLPARSEAFGLVLAEALACGTPVVGRADGGIPEVLGDDPAVGALFTEPTPAALADALLRVIETSRAPATRAACRQRAQRFSRDTCVEAYRSLYGELLG